MDSHALKDAITDAIRFWETLRVVYNAILALIVVAYFWMGFPGSQAVLKAGFVLTIFLLAVIANVAYCAAYLVDVFAQISDFREIWRRVRWVIFAVGTLFAAIITRFIAAGIFQNR